MPSHTLASAPLERFKGERRTYRVPLERKTSQGEASCAAMEWQVFFADIREKKIEHLAKATDSGPVILA